MIKYVYDDGGREEAGYKGKTGDCCCRAISIATGMPYKEVYKLINKYSEQETPNLKSRRGNSHKQHRSDARTGVYKETMHKIMKDLGWTWVPTMRVGEGCTTHLDNKELPNGTIICNVSRHYVAIIDGVIHDTYDCSREGTRCVYGYWINPQKGNNRPTHVENWKDFLFNKVEPIIKDINSHIVGIQYNKDKEGQEFVRVVKELPYETTSCLWKISNLTKKQLLQKILEWI